MKSTFFVAALAWAASLTIGHSTTITFSPVPTAREVQTGAGVRLDTTSLVMAGNFANESFSLNSSLTLQQNVAAIMAAGGWEQFGFDTQTGVSNGGTSTLAISATGKIGGSATDNANATTSPTGADYFNGKAVYVWIFNAPTVGAATEMGIFRATTAAPPWAFPTNGGGLGDATTFSTTSTGAATIAAIGGVGSTPAGFLRTASLAPIPEPTTAFFGVLTALAAISSRKRRK